MSLTSVSLIHVLFCTLYYGARKLSLISLSYQAHFGGFELLWSEVWLG